MDTWKAVVRWLTLVPVAIAGGLLGRAALVLLTRLGFMFSGVVEFGSQEFAVLSWLYELAGDALAGGLFVWIASQWAPSRAMTAAVTVCLAVCVLGSASIYVAFTVTYDTSVAIGTLATLVGALLGLGYVLGEHLGDEEWLESTITKEWHGVGQSAHLILAGIATVPLWWWAADPVGEWQHATAGISLLAWPLAVGGWLWRTVLTALLTYLVSFVILLLVLLALKLPLILAYRIATRPSLGETHTGLPAPPPATPTGDGGEGEFADNVIFTQEMVDAARARLRERGLLQTPEGRPASSSDGSPEER